MNRSKMIYAYLVFLLVWYGGVILSVKMFGLDAMDTLGLGTAGGVFLGAFQNAWQFMWRTSSPQEKAAIEKAPKP